jgi:hypothetical protein
MTNIDFMPYYLTQNIRESIESVFSVIIEFHYIMIGHFYQVERKKRDNHDGISPL